jgi:hypothetical protein
MLIGEFEVFVIEIANNSSDGALTTSAGMLATSEIGAGEVSIGGDGWAKLSVEHRSMQRIGNQSLSGTLPVDQMVRRRAFSFIFTIRSHSISVRISSVFTSLSRWRCRALAFARDLLDTEGA